MKTKKLKNESKLAKLCERLGMGYIVEQLENGNFVVKIIGKSFMCIIETEQKFIADDAVSEALLELEYI